MTASRRGWAVVLRDLSPVDGDEGDVVSVLHVYREEATARAEVERLRDADKNEDRFYYYEETEVES